jgi:hypothetical protein
MVVPSEKETTDQSLTQMPSVVVFPRVQIDAMLRVGYRADGDSKTTFGSFWHF